MHFAPPRRPRHLSCKFIDVTLILALISNRAALIGQSHVAALVGAAV